MSLRLWKVQLTWLCLLAWLRSTTLLTPSIYIPVNTQRLGTNICDRICMNHPFTAKCNFWVQPKIAAMSAQDRYSVIYMDGIYSVLAILCRGMKCRLRIVSPGVTLLLPFTDKECGDVNGPCKQSQSIVKNT